MALTKTKPLSLINACLAYAAISYGWGRPFITLSPENYTKTMKLQFAVQTTWIFTLCFVRLSVACSLLRFGTDLWWRYTLYAIIGIQIAISSSYIVIQFGQCKPIASNWESVNNVECWNLHAIINYGWAVAGMADAHFTTYGMYSNLHSYIRHHGPHPLPHAY